MFRKSRRSTALKFTNYQKYGFIILRKRPAERSGASSEGKLYLFSASCVHSAEIFSVRAGGVYSYHCAV
jgi:hypothetical protein